MRLRLTKTHRSTMRLLLINPNSTESMTSAAAARISSYLDAAYPGKARDNFEVSLFTGPPDAPAQIDGEEASRESAAKCLPLLCQRATPSSRKYFDTFDGVLVACFSDHPLVHDLVRESEHVTPVAGIFHASITVCLARPAAPFSIITSNDEWVELLDSAAARMLGSTPPFANSPAPFKGTIASSLPVLDLHNPRNLRAIARRIYDQNVLRLRTHTVILGCAGFSGLEAPLRQEITELARQDDPNTPLQLTLVDSVVSGFETLASMCRLARDAKATDGHTS